MDSQLKRHSAVVLYHSQFDYPLTKQELTIWKPGKKFPIKNYSGKITTKSGYYYKAGSKNLILTRVKREKLAKKKMAIAQKAANFLSYLPTVCFVGITGSLAMSNAASDSDIDLMIITNSDSLWLTRGIGLVLMKIWGFRLRRAQDANEKDKLCLNLWLEEDYLKWVDKNEYSAHEICQIIPLVNKNNAFEKFLFANKWVLDYWPNAVTIPNIKQKANSDTLSVPRFLEKLAFKLQYLYMKKKITNEVITLKRAQFHPVKLLPKSLF